MCAYEVAFKCLCESTLTVPQELGHFVEAIASSEKKEKNKRGKKKENSVIKAYRVAVAVV